MKNGASISFIRASRVLTSPAGTPDTSRSPLDEVGSREKAAGVSSGASTPPALLEIFSTAFMRSNAKVHRRAGRSGVAAKAGPSGGTYCWAFYGAGLVPLDVNVTSYTTPSEP